MGVFDGFDISDGTKVVTTIDRPVGPLERGYFDPLTHVWVPEARAQELEVSPGFGIAGGTVYYDTVSVTVGQEARVFIDPRDGTITLESV